MKNIWWTIFSSVEVNLWFQERYWKLWVFIPVTGWLFCFQKSIRQALGSGGNLKGQRSWGYQKTNSVKWSHASILLLLYASSHDLGRSIVFWRGKKKLQRLLVLIKRTNKKHLWNKLLKCSVGESLLGMFLNCHLEQFF